VKKFLQISDVLLVKIQNESNMIKWAHLAHDAYGGYFLPPVSAEQKPCDSLVPSLEQATEVSAIVQKSPLLEQNSVEWADNSVAGDSRCGPTRGNRILLKNHGYSLLFGDFLFFSYNLSVVVSLNVDYMVHCGSY
jgi:hypothetical protein